MCGIAGIYHMKKKPQEGLVHALTVMRDLIAHRGPDDAGLWLHEAQYLGLAHRRLSIIDLSDYAHQPMLAPCGTVIVYNGELYNYRELRAQLADHWQFRTQSDTEVILAAYKVYGTDCLTHFQGMFAFAIWDGMHFFCARDPFGIKPFYYTVQDECFIFASETKALLPFLPTITTDRQAFVEYITFQYPMGEKTLFSGVHQLEPAHAMLITPDGMNTWRYWDLHYHIDYDHTPQYFYRRLQELLEESVTLHTRADVAMGAYVSGGVDSSLMGLLASQITGSSLPFFHGRFAQPSGFDESNYARMVRDKTGSMLYICDLDAGQFAEYFEKILYHMDFPVAGPGVFPQYMVSQMAAQHVKVVLGGQGGDEIFGGYARYVMAYFEQCIKASIEGTYKSGNFVVTASSILPNLEVLKDYKPLLKQFWRDGLFESLEKRYFRLIDRGLDLDGEVYISDAEKTAVYDAFLRVYNVAKFEKAESYLDSMTHFDFKCLLPGLLHVEDRVSMAHGLEARVPFLYVPLIEFMATVPASIKFADGRMKHMLKSAYAHKIPAGIIERKDKMGFPVPLNQWIGGDLKTFIYDLLHAGAARQGNPIDYQRLIQTINHSGSFSRKVWGFLCYEMWQQIFHDRAQHYRRLLHS